MMDLASGLRAPFTERGRALAVGAWSLDGRRVALQEDGSLVVRAVDDATAAEASTRTTEGGLWVPWSWSLDGSSVIASLYLGVKGFDLVVVGSDGRGEPKELLATPASETRGILSPDGRWLAYTSDESGEPQLYVAPYPALQRRLPMTGDGLRDFAWTGPTELVYWDPEDRAYSVAFRETASGLELGARRPAFGGRPFPREPAAYVRSSARFLVATTVEGQETRNSLVLVTNWQQALEK